MGIVLLWSDNAKDDLKEIYQYYKLKAGKQVADKIINAIVEKTMILKHKARIGQKEDFFADKYQEIRYLVEGNYKIVYLIENEFIITSTIFDCRQNPKKLKETKF